MFSPASEAARIIEHKKGHKLPHIGGGSVRIVRRKIAPGINDNDWYNYLPTTQYTTLMAELHNFGGELPALRGTTPT